MGKTENWSLKSKALEPKIGFHDLSPSHYGPEKKKTLDKMLTNQPHSYEQGSERSEWASEQVSAAEHASEASCAGLANESAVQAD